MIRHALFLCALAFAVSGIPSLASAQSEPTGAAALARAMEAVADRDWVRANRAAARVGSGSVGLATDIVDWHRLRRADSGARFAEYRDFLARNPDWPGLPYMRRQGEGSIPVGGPPEHVIAYFGDRVPVTSHGALRLIEAYFLNGQEAEAEALAVQVWLTLPLAEDERAQLLAAYGGILAPYHTARLDEMLWQGAEDNARALMDMVSDGWRALAEARLALRAEADGVDARIGAVPSELKGDAGLAYERFRWRVSKGRAASALELLEERTASADLLGRPDLWAERRRFYTRDLMRDGALRRAYAVASNHHLTEGRSYADLEWLSGYLALRLNRPEQAVTHFSKFREAVFTPISLGRAGYWLGRAHDAAGDAARASEAWEFGAQYQSSFYGLLSAEALDAPLSPAMSGGERFAPLSQAPFAGSSVLAAGLLLYEANQMQLSERFLTHLTEEKPRDQAGQLAQLALTLEDPHLALRIAKRAANYGHVLPDAYYPLSPIARQQLSVPPELVLSIARRESEFDPGVVSPAGARGLMQVMPGTAREMSGVLEEPYNAGALLSDPAYNLRLGAAYLAELSQTYDGNPVLIAAAYNAGPSRADRWIERFGDPRSRNVDIITWIENIPFRETRNYIMRVTESLPVYAARLGAQQTEPLDFTGFLKGRSAGFGAPATR